MLFDGLVADSFVKSQPQTRKRIAALISNIFNPFVIGMALVLLIALGSTVNLSDALKWLLLLAAINVLPIGLFMVYLVRRDRLDSLFANVRRQRTKLYVLATVVFGVSCIILLFLDTPSILMALFVATFTSNVIFMCINLRWKVSLHTAFITCAVVILLVLYGFQSVAFIVSASLIPLIAWARIELDHHSLPQVIAGALLSSSILVAVFYLFGLI